MADNKREMIDDEFLDDVAGGILFWQGDRTVRIKDDPESPVYYFSDYRACQKFMSTSCRGYSDPETLKALLKEGLITESL